MRIEVRFSQILFDQFGRLHGIDRDGVVWRQEQQDTSWVWRKLDMPVFEQTPRYQGPPICNQHAPHNPTTGGVALGCGLPKDHEGQHSWE